MMNSDQEQQGYPSNAEDAEAFIAGLTFDDTAEVPPLPPTAEQIERGMATTSFKWPAQMRDQVREVAAKHCLSPSMLIRQYIEMGLAAERPEEMISLSDAIRALSTLRPTA